MKKKIDDLTLKEAHNICASQKTCVHCPLIIKSKCFITTIGNDFDEHDKDLEVEIDDIH